MKNIYDNPPSQSLVEAVRGITTLSEATAHERVQAHKAVSRVDNGGKGDYFVMLKKPYHWDGQRSFGVEGPSHALKMLKDVKPGVAGVDFEEGYEPIEELSRGTLGNYAKVAMADREDKMMRAKKHADVGHEYKNRGDRESADLMFDRAADFNRRASNRKKGAVTAINKLTKEESEINELSRATLISYNKKAGSEAGRKHAKLFKKHSKIDADGKMGVPYDEMSASMDADPEYRKIRNRWKGQRLAKGKVKAKDKAWLAQAKQHRTNEETEINELSKATLGRYIKKSVWNTQDQRINQTKQFQSAADMAKAGIDSAADYHMKAGIQTGRKIIKRENGISKAVDKITKESKED